MNKLIIAAISMLFAASVYAADQEVKDSATVDHSKNPITGTKTTKREWKSKKKNADGKAEAKTTETTKVGTDGSVDKKVETETSSDPK
jgi:hypothetical protein